MFAGRTAGGAYAAAQANDEVGASAVLGGSVGERGYIGSEAHAPGKVHSSSAQITPHVATAAPSADVELPPPVPTQSSYVQRVKPPKKYSLIAPNVSKGKGVELETYLAWFRLASIDKAGKLKKSKCRRILVESLSN